MSMTDKKTERKIGISTLYLVSHSFQKSDKGPTRLRNQSQYKEPSFCSSIRPQDPKNQCWSPENQWHYFKALEDSSLYFFYIE